MNDETKAGVRAHKWVGPNTGLMDGFCERCGVPYDSNEWEAGCAGPTFYREARYTIIKLSDVRKLPVAQQIAIGHCVEALGVLLGAAGLPMREAVVVEKDWPEYESTWAAIESRWYREQREKK